MTPPTGTRLAGEAERQRASWAARIRALPRGIATIAGTPLGTILEVALAFRLTGLFWGLPGSDGWDDDGVAPRDFLVGVGQTYWPGQHYVYPPLHLLILTFVEAPIWLLTLLQVHSWAPQDVIRTFTAVLPMTSMAVVARAVTIAMSLGLVWNTAKIGEMLGGSKRAGCWTAAVCGANAVFTYYSQTTNLDVPYLFWGVLSLRWLVQAIAQREPRLLRRVMVLAACAVATKDQAYALFLLGVPAALLGWFAIDPDARGLGRTVAQELAIGAAAGLALLLVVDGAVVNPSGFADRVRTLLGPASQDHANYPRGWVGSLAVLGESARTFDRYYPWVFVPLILLGVVAGLRLKDRARRAASFAPLAFALSFTVAFNLTARRTEHRFLLPQALLCGIYAGLAFAWLEQKLPPRVRFVSLATGLGCLGWALFHCAAVDAAMVLDPRYDAERWLQTHLRPGDRIEVYGSNVHLPRFPADAIATRVDPSPLAGRSPLPGVTEISDRFRNVEARRPRFILVSEFWAEKYLAPPETLARDGRVLSPEQVRLQGERDSRDYFRELRGGLLAYRWAHVSTWESRLWPRVDIHASLTRDVWIFERVDGT